MKLNGMRKDFDLELDGELAKILEEFIKKRTGKTVTVKGLCFSVGLRTLIFNYEETEDKDV